MGIELEKIWKEFHAKLKQFVHKRVSDEHAVEDILQEVFIKIHTHIDALKDERKLEGWIYRITRNAITDYFRQLPRVTETPELPESVREEPDTADLQEEVASCLQPMIEQLPEQYRQAIVAVELKGLTQRELGEQLGLSLSGAKSRVQRGRERLREMLLECCHFEFDRLGTILDYQPNAHPCQYCGQPPAGD